MIVHALQAAPSADMTEALAEFESRFTYPLGADRSFRIDHGRDYPRFFRAMGDATCFICEKKGRITGALGVAVRPIISPDGVKLRAAYIGDLKVDPVEGGPRTFLRLALAADAWVRPQVVAAFGVVMDGTRILPASYTGRAGVEAFLQVARVIVLRLPTSASASPTDCCPIIGGVAGAECYCRLSRGRYAVPGGDAAERSQMPPRWLAHSEGLACGRIEDTRQGKRLIDTRGIEIESAHLSCFAFRTPRAAAALIQTALRHAAQAGLPGMFVSISHADWPILQPALAGTEVSVAPATVYGAGVSGGYAWNINSSEI